MFFYLRSDDSEEKGKNTKGKKVNRNINKPISTTVPKKYDYIYNLLPLRENELDGTGIRKAEGKYLNIYSVLPQDYPNLSETDVCIQASNFDMFFRSFDRGVKFFSLNMLIDTHTNEEFLSHKIKTAKKNVYRRILRAEIKEMQEYKMQTRQFYMMIFADTKEEMNEYNDIVFSSLVASGLVEPISPEEKENIITKLNNPNSQVFYA